METPAPLSFDGPDRVKIASGGGCLILFGLPFFAAGLFMLLGCFGVVPFENMDEAPLFARFILLLIGATFTAVGASLMFLRQTIILDRARKSATDEKRFLGYVFKKEMRLPDYSVVTIRLVAGDSDSADSFPVTLEGAEAAKKLKIHASTSFGKSDRIAAFLADFLGLPCKDFTTGSVRVVRTGNAGKAPQKQETGYAPPPQNRRSVIEDINGELKIALPAFPPVIFSVLVWAIFAGIVVSAFPVVSFWRGVFQNAGSISLHRPEKIENAADWFLLLFFGALTFIVFIAPLFRLLKNKGGRFLAVSSESVVYEKKKIAAFDILAVDAIARAQAPKPESSSSNPFASPDSLLSQSLKETLAQKLKEGIFYANKIQIKTRQEIIDIPTGVSGEETEYLRGLIERRLAKTAKILRS
mgnify:CR=1 FL=1